MEDSRGTSRKIRSDRAIEYALYTNEPAILFLMNRPDNRANAQLTEFTKENLTVEVKKDVAFSRTLAEAKEKSETLRVQLTYKNAVLLIEAKIVEIRLNPTSTMLTLTISDLATLENSRALPRYTLAEITDNLSLELSIANGQKTSQLVTTQLQDLSEHAISFFFSPSQGSVLPGDIVKNLKLIQDGKLLLDTTGEISRIDSKRNSSCNAKTYFSVVRFRSLQTEDILKSRVYEERRKLIRIKLDEIRGEVKFHHPLFKEYALNGEMIDIHGAGISFVLLDVSCPLPSGMYIRNVEIKLPNTDPFMVSMKLVYSRREQVGGKNQVHLGGEFFELSPESLRCLGVKS